MLGWARACGALVLAIVASAAGAAWAGGGGAVRPLVEGTLTLTSVADGYVFSSPQGSGIGGGDYAIVASGGGYGEAWALVKFDLSQLPPGATVSAASLHFRAELRLVPRGQGLGVRVYEPPAAWNEDTINWDLFGGNRGEPLAFLTLTGSDLASYTVDVTDVVKAWVAGTRTNNGLLVAPIEGLIGNYVAYVRTRETGPSLAPQLRLTYDAPATPTPTPAAVATTGPTATPAPAGTPTATPTPSPTPAPTATPRPAGPTRLYLPALLKNIAPGRLGR